jgi:hypothetical protein
VTVDQIHKEITASGVERYRELVFGNFDDFTRANYAAFIIKGRSGEVTDQERDEAARILNIPTPVRQACRRCGGAVCTP